MILCRATNVCAARALCQVFSRTAGSTSVDARAAARPFSVADASSADKTHQKATLTMSAHPEVHWRSLDTEDLRTMLRVGRGLPALFAKVGIQHNHVLSLLEPVKPGIDEAITLGRIEHVLRVGCTVDSEPVVVNCSYKNENQKTLTFRKFLKELKQAILCVQVLARAAPQNQTVPYSGFYSQESSSGRSSMSNSLENIP